MSKKRAMARPSGTLGGALIAGYLVRVDSVTALVVIGALFGTLNGLYKKAKVGQVPLFYTAATLLLYSLNDIESGQELAFIGLGCNMAGVAIAVFVVLYPFPFLTKRLRRKDEAPQE